MECVTPSRERQIAIGPFKEETFHHGLCDRIGCLRHPHRSPTDRRVADLLGGGAIEFARATLAGGAAGVILSPGSYARLSVIRYLYRAGAAVCGPFVPLEGCGQRHSAVC